MANYGIGGMVPDVVGAIGGGLQTARGLDYWDDRKRRIAQQESQQKRQAMADFSLIAKNVDRNNPAQVKQALAWAATRSPQMKDTVWKALQGTPEEQLNFIDMFQAPTKPSQKAVELKNKNLQVINAIAPKIEEGTASEDEIRMYRLAEDEYTREKVITDPVTGDIIKQTPSLPRGLPTFKEDKKIEMPSDVKKALGGISFKQISDPTRISKEELKKYRTSVDSSERMIDIIKELRGEIKKEGLRTVDVEKIASRKSRFNNALMLYKEILNLGVLNGPDLDMMARIVKDPTSLSSMAIGDKWVLPGYDSIINILESQIKNIESKTKGAVTGMKKEPEQYQTVTTQEQYNALPSGSIYMEDGQQYRKP